MTSYGTAVAVVAVAAMIAYDDVGNDRESAGGGRSETPEQPSRQESRRRFVGPVSYSSPCRQLLVQSSGRQRVVRDSNERMNEGKERRSSIRNAERWRMTVTHLSVPVFALRSFPQR